MKTNQPQSKPTFGQFMWSLWRPVRFATLVVLLAMMATEVFRLLRQYILKNVIDLPLQDNFQFADLTFYVISFFVCYVLEIIVKYLGCIIRQIHIYKKQTPYATQILFQQISQKQYAFFSDNYSGKITTSMNQVIDGTAELNSCMSVSLVMSVASIVSNLIILCSIDYLLFEVVFVLCLVITVTRILFFKKLYLPSMRCSQEFKRDFDGVLNDTVVNFTSIRIYNAVHKFGSDLKRKRESVNEYCVKARRRAFIFGSIINVVYLVTFALLSWYAILGFQDGNISLGDFVFFCGAVVTLKSNTTVFEEAYVNIGELLGKFKTSYNVLYQGEDDAQDRDKPDLTITSGKVEFQNVCFKYTQKNVLQDFSMTIADKQKIGLIGASGSGKTTISNLLFKFFTPQSGQILVDGKNIQDYNNQSLYANITYIPQETILLHSTILDNIRLVKPDASLDEIITAAKRAQIHDFIMNLDQQYETIVGERGIKLSGGQRQRIALARVFLRNAKVVVFDEATSSLDGTTESAVQENINTCFQDQTVICIAHRLSTLAHMDWIYVLQDGKIVNAGKPAVILPQYETQHTTFDDNLLSAEK